MSAKAQAFSIDFLVASVIFIIALTIIYTYWGYSAIQIEETRLTNDMSDKLNLASQVWFREGTPKYWNPDGVVQIGMQNDGQFNSTKMSFLKNNISYGKAATMMGIDDYYLYYRVYNETNSTLFEFGWYPFNSSMIVKAQRIGILNGSIAKVDVIIWR